MVSYQPVMILMSVMVIKHYIADFLLQTSGIARGKAASEGWLVPLVLHAAGHAAITLAIALLYFPGTWWVAAVEFLLHAGIDRTKVWVGRRAHLTPVTTSYWWLFGFDQLLHQLTNVAIIAVFLTALRP